MTQDSEPLRNSGEDPEVIVAAVDSSNGAARVIAMAARLARAFPGAALHIVHVFRTSRFDRAHAGAPLANPDALADAKDHLELRVRAEIHGDVLVIGTHDHSGFERLLLGSIADNLMRKAGCSVLVVRPTKAR